MNATLKRVLPLIVIAALVVAAALTMTGGDERKTLTAHFPRTISIYEGSDVRILGVPVGEVVSVTPSGTDVAVEMAYDAEVRLPADARAVIVAPSIVGDRFIQLTPTYEEGQQVLADDATLEADRTAVPLELDQIYSSIDDLTVALGPDGANKEGALTDLLEVTAQNFAGQGATFNQTIRDFGDLSATLEDNKEEFFGSARKLEAFISTLAQNDETVRSFNQSLADVSGMLAGEREELSASLENLSVALGQVSTFVSDNREVLGRDITALNRVAKVLVKQRGALDEVLKAGPLALNNLYLAYNPQTGTLDTNANIGQLEGQLVSDPSLLLCTVLNQNDPTGALCQLVQGILPRAGALGRTTTPDPATTLDPTLGGLVEATR
jgi:phospholipid/cholesterol/gamma-HCH transport system substrate-binding protein